MSVKMIMTWDIAPNHEQEYFEFVVREFIPAVKHMGVDLSDAWATVYGDRPQILITAVAPSLSKARQLLRSAEWKEIQSRLLELVVNFNVKIVEARNSFQF
jgi:hypothetical protein